ncbi:hypothetical protein PIB30_065601 [Stylosanthes scabra]|uniref:Uncharacterized protein n=1 Tax=Stylosanthes scabra TaxID=79078 RepID=A0ABU6RM50_9FABA|nr:hypothetical protein [Stylosanthes scabra]
MARFKCGEVIKLVPMGFNRQSSEQKWPERVKRNERIATKPRRLKLEPMRTHPWSHAYASWPWAARLFGRTDTYAVRSLRHGFTTVITGKSALGPGDNEFLKSSFSPGYWIADSNAKLHHHTCHRLRVHSSNADLLESIVGSVPHNWYAKDTRRFLLGDSSSDLGHSGDYRDA